MLDRFEFFDAGWLPGLPWQDDSADRVLVAEFVFDLRLWLRGHRSQWRL